MLKSYFLIALRNIRRERTYAVINITGLAIGLAICLLVMAYVVDEWNFDRFHANQENLFRVNEVVSSPAGTAYEANTPFPLSDLITEQIPEVQSAVQVIPMVGVMVSANHRAFHEMLSLADQEFFQTFTFPLASGDGATALSDPGNVVVTESFAEKLFGSTEVVGKTVTISWGNYVNEFTVSAVAHDVPHNSSLTFNIIIPKVAMKRFFGLNKSWNTSWPETYVLVRSGAEIREVEKNINTAVAAAVKGQPANTKSRYALQNISDIHLNPEVTGGAGNPSSPVYSYLLCLVAFFILELACINFTTLAIGRAQHRIKEIGARKVMGASRRQVIIQVLGETFIVAAAAMLLAFVLAELALPQFATLAGKSFTSIITATGWWALLAVWLVIVAALFAGGYPALILSRANSIDAVRGKATLLSGRSVMRGLVVLQFAVSAALIAVTLSMSNQLKFMLNSPLGFDKDALVMLRLDGSGDERIGTVNRLRESLSSHAEIKSIAASSADFSGGGVRMGNKVGPDSIDLTIFVNAVDYAYIKTMGLHLTSGEDFRDGAISSGTITNVIVNETLVKTMQWDDPIGKEAPLLPDSRIVGVVQDFHIQPFTAAIEPLALVQTSHSNDLSENLQYAVLRLDPNSISGSMKLIESTWQSVAPDLPFDYEFMDAHIAAQYRSYLRWAEIIKDAAILAVVIAGFGVFGLTALALARRRKEIGIRKILGAKAGQLVAMFYREFAALVIIGNLIALPLAYWSVNSWLAGFVYRTSLSPIPFVVGIVLLFGIVILTVSAQALRASTANVAEVVRYE